MTLNSKFDVKEKVGIFTVEKKFHVAEKQKTIKINKQKSLGELDF